MLFLQRTASTPALSMWAPSTISGITRNEEVHSHAAMPRSYSYSQTTSTVPSAKGAGVKKVATRLIARIFPVARLRCVRPVQSGVAPSPTACEAIIGQQLWPPSPSAPRGAHKHNLLQHNRSAPDCPHCARIFIPLFKGNKINGVAVGTGATSVYGDYKSKNKVPSNHVHLAQTTFPVGQHRPHARSFLKLPKV